ncbi:MAG: ribulose-phosphate 3-epimerase [Thermomicrobiales bacterium]
MPSHPVLLGPSILSADFLRLGEQIAEAEAAGADYIHVDIMDGRFVPNISVGLPIVAAVRRATGLPVDVHLMIVEPERYVQAFVQAGATTLTVHVEATTHLHRTVQAIAEAGAAPSVTLNPATPLIMVEEILPLARQILVMSVNPGFGGQTFIPAALERIVRLRRQIDRKELDCTIQVDGGITATNIASVVEAGASSIVAGSAVFGAGIPVSEAVRALRDSTNP